MRFLVAVLLLSSCSPPNGRPQVRIAVLAASVSHLSVYLAKSLGYFEQEGLDVRLEELNSSGKSMEALLGGSVELAAGNYEVILQANAAGRDVRSLYILATRPFLVLAAAPGRSEIASIPDLKGRTVGVAALGSNGQTLLSFLLIRHGMTLADVAPVAIGNSASAIAALEYGKVDAAILNSAVFEMLRVRHPGVAVLLDSRTEAGASGLFGVPDLPGPAVAATARWLAGNRDIALHVTRALTRASQWMHQQPLETIEANLPESLRTPGSEAGSNTLRMALPVLSASGRMPPGGPAVVLHFLKVAVDPSLNVNLANTYTDEFLEAQP